jgi:hypothetical protein
MKQAILTSCRNKICFGGISAQDAQDFVDEFGKDKVIMRQSTYKNRILLPRLFTDSYRDAEDEEYRFDPTDLMDGIPKYNFVHKLLQDGTPQKPALAKGQFVPRNWKELREWEDGTSFKKLKKNSLLKRFQKRKKKEQVAGLEQAEQMEAESLTEPIIQPETESLYSFGANPVSPSLVRADIGGIEVKISLEEIKYGWIYDLTEEVIVSAKATKENPWLRSIGRYTSGNEYVGTVSGVREYGVFINLEAGVDSLALHLKFQNVKRGDRVLVRVLETDAKKEQIRARITRVL